MITVASIIASVRTTLLDNFAGVKAYSDAELLLAINSCSSWILNGDPSANVVTEEMNLVVGIHQHASADIVRILDIWGNAVPSVSEVVEGVTYSGTAPLRYVDTAKYRYALQDWGAAEPKTIAVNVVFDDNDPRHFIVFPPNNGSGKVTITASKIPAQVNTISESLAMPALYLEAYVNYTLYKALSRDGEDQSNTAAASAYFSLAERAIQARLTANLAAKPDTTTRA